MSQPEELKVGDIVWVNETRYKVLWCDPTEYGMRLTLEVIKEGMDAK